MLVVGGAAVVWWLSRYAVAVHRLTRGIGDTRFYGADGQPWFRLDEQRHDVSLAEIAPDLQHAVVAVEDRRFYHPPGHRSDRRRARRRARRARRRTHRRRQHADAAARAHAVPVERPDATAARSRKPAIALLIEAQLSKKQILEFYLNRVYLSAGVYGVETMSEHLFRKPASAVTLPEAALIAGLIRAPSALSPWSNYDGALERSHLVLAQMREQGFITAAQERRRGRCGPRFSRIGSRATRARGVGEGVSAPAVRNEFGGDNPPDWQVHTSFDAAVQDAAEHAVATGLERLDARDSRRRSSRSIRRPATSWRWSAAPTTRAAPSIARPAAGASPARRSSRWCTPRRWRDGYSPVSVLTNLSEGVGARRSGMEPAQREPCSSKTLTLRAALARIEQRRRRGSAAARRLAGRAAARVATPA